MTQKERDRLGEDRPMSSFSTYLYLLRVPLLSWLFVVIFGPLAMRMDLPSAAGTFTNGRT